MFINARVWNIIGRTKRGKDKNKLLAI
jgi:hypothetical protein